MTNNSHTLATFICAFQSESQQERPVLSWKLLVTFVSSYINLSTDYLIRFNIDLLYILLSPPSLVI